MTAPSSPPLWGKRRRILVEKGMGNARWADSKPAFAILPSVYTRCLAVEGEALNLGGLSFSTTVYRTGAFPSDAITDTMIIAPIRRTVQCQAPYGGHGNLPPHIHT